MTGRCDSLVVTGGSDNLVVTGGSDNLVVTDSFDGVVVTGVTYFHGISEFGFGHWYNVVGEFVTVEFHEMKTTLPSNSLHNSVLTHSRRTINKN